MPISYVDQKGRIVKKEKPGFKREEKPQEKGKEEKKKGYFNRFAGKNVEIKLTTGDVLAGIIETDAYNKFDTVLNNERGSFLIPKHSILYITQKGKEKNFSVKKVP